MTRKEYLDSRSPTAHREYYAQFVTEGTRALVRLRLGDKITTSDDPNFNDIPLSQWDTMSHTLGNAARLMRTFGDYLTPAGAVCVLKEAAQQVREGVH